MWWHQFKRKNLEKLATELGFTKREEIVAEAVLKIADRLAEQAGPFLKQAEGDFPSLRIPSKLAAEIEKRINTFREKFKALKKT